MSLLAGLDFDVVIVGAGLSGIGAACHLQKQLPGKTYTILEAREAIGGTWDLFRYPGVRSDSDMYTLGYNFKPWPGAKAIADGPSIREYVREAARENSVDRHIRFRHRVISLAWSSASARWTVMAMSGSRPVELSCSFVMMCSGYYNYDHGYTPEFAGIGAYRGKLVHPQYWPDDLPYQGKQVVVIGSGATAVTIVPEMARNGAHVTMLQRSPTYVVSRPAQDKIANRLRKLLPAKMAYALTRWKNIGLQMLFYSRARKHPQATRNLIARLAQKELGPDYPVATHFNPRYNPWDQRMCLIPDGDLFREIKAGNAEVVTDTIAGFTELGVRLSSGKELKADIVVTATGLDLQFLGGAAVTVDGQQVDLAKRLTYKGMMYEGAPNLVSVFGYTNASWTLKCDLTCEFACRMMKRLATAGKRSVTPRLILGETKEQPWLDFSSGYVQRAIDRFPKQGDRKPWRLNQNYAADLLMLRYGKLDDPELVFS